MRNRGIEIYILNECETSTPDNNFDIMSLVHLAGLTDMSLIKILLRIHSYISDLILGEKPQIKDLLQAASSVAHQLNYGTQLLEAFQDTFLEIYFKPRFTAEFNCNNPSDLIKGEIERVIRDVKHDKTKELFCENVTIKTQNIEMSSALAKIEQQSGILLQCLQHCDRSLVVYLLATFYSVSSAEDKDLRQVFIEQRLLNDGLKQLSKHFYKIICDHDCFNNLSLPFDHNWVKDTPYGSRHLLKSDNLNLALFIASFFFLEQLEYDEIKIKSLKQKEVTLLDYMYQKQSKKVQDKFNNILVTEYIDLKNNFDQYLLNMPNSLGESSNTSVINLLYLVFWRFALHKSTLKDIKHINADEQQNIIMNLSVHYKWFYKYAVQKLSCTTNVTIPDNFKQILERINEKLYKEFSMIQKFGKTCQKYSEKPPPFVNQHQIEVTSLYNEISKQYNICDKRNDPVKIVSIFKREKGLRYLLIDTKSNMDFEFKDLTCRITELKKIHENLEQLPIDDINFQFELEIIPVLDYFLQLQVRRIFINENYTEVIQSAILPVDFCGTLALYAKMKDTRLNSELTKNLYLYLMNSASVKPGRYFNEHNCDQILSYFSPKICYFVNNLLIKGDNSTTITLGNFRQLIQQHRHLSLILWMKLNRIYEKYNFV